MSDEMVECPCCGNSAPRQKVKEHLRTIHGTLVDFGLKMLKATVEPFRYGLNAKPLFVGEHSQSNRQRSEHCICSDTDPHFCPPSFGDAGFYWCDPVRFPKR